MYKHKTINVHIKLVLWYLIVNLFRDFIVKWLELFLSWNENKKYKSLHVT